MTEITTDILRSIDGLDPEVIDNLPYKSHPMADLMTVATPAALVERARLVRMTHKMVDRESTAAHLELAAETISMLIRYLPR